MTKIDVSGCVYIYKNTDCLCGGDETSSVKCNDNADCMYKQLKRLEAENEALYEEKNCLHKIIDRLLENSGYSKDIASAEDFEDVYEDMQIKRNEFIELEQENANLKEKLEKIKEVAKIYRENCKIEGNCLDKRLCSSCYFGGGLEVCDDILDIIEGAEDEYTSL